MKIREMFTKYGDITLATMAGLILRLATIGKDEFWYDESFTGILMRLPLKEFWNIAAVDPTPPFYYILLKIWTTFVGVGDIQLRLLSVIFGTLTIPVLYLVMKHISTKESAAFSAALVAISPFFVGYSVEARSYSLYGLVTILTFYFLIKKRLFIFMLGTLIMLITHYTAGMYVLVMLGAYFWIIYENKFALVKGIIRILPTIIVLVLTLLYANNSATGAINAGWIKPATFINIPQSVSAHLYGIQTKLTGADTVNTINFVLDEFVLGWLVFVIYVMGLSIYFYKNRKKFKDTTNLLIIVALAHIPQLIIIAISLITKEQYYVERYLYPSALFFMISVVYILTKLLPFEFTLLFLGMYVFTLTRYQHPNYNTGMTKIRDEYIRSEKTIVFTSPIDYVNARYYMGENNVNVRLHNPNEPENTYEWWQMIPAYAHTKDLKTAIIVTTDNNTLPNEEYLQINDFESYKVFVKKR